MSSYGRRMDFGYSPPPGDREMGMFGPRDIELFVDTVLPHFR